MLNFIAVDLQLYNIFKITQCTTADCQRHLCLFQFLCVSKVSILISCYSFFPDAINHFANKDSYENN